MKLRTLLLSGIAFGSLFILLLPAHSEDALAEKLAVVVRKISASKNFLPAEMIRIAGKHEWKTNGETAYVSADHKSTDLVDEVEISQNPSLPSPQRFYAVEVRLSKDKSLTLSEAEKTFGKWSTSRTLVSKPPKQTIYGCDKVTILSYPKRDGHVVSLFVCDDANKIVKAIEIAVK